MSSNQNKTHAVPASSSLNGFRENQMQGKEKVNFVMRHTQRGISRRERVQMEEQKSRQKIIIAIILVICVGEKNYSCFKQL